MKAVDTPALLGLLHGDPSVRAPLKDWQGEELATTELNLLELTWISLAAPPRVQGERLRSLERLRRRITVLPIDSRTQAEVARAGLAGSPPFHSGITQAIYATLAAAGCSEVLTVGLRRRARIYQRLSLERKEKKDATSRKPRY